MKIPTMTHIGIAGAQVIITILFLLGFFALAVMEGLGWFKVSLINNLREVLMLVMSFWFMRQRNSVDSNKEDTVPPTKPTT
jgi:hypothetical protein